MMKKCLLFVVLSFLWVNNSNAQRTQIAYMDFIKDVRAVTIAPNLAYKYQISIIDKKSNKESEKIQGLYYKAGKSYLDSNSYIFSLLADGFFFKADIKEKTAYLYRLSSVEKKMGIKASDFDNVLFSIPDSMALKLGTFSLLEKDGNAILSYTLKNKEATFNFFQFTIRKRDRHLMEIRMISPSEDGSQKIYRLVDFTNAFDLGKIRGQKYYSIQDNKAVLNGPFHHYKVQAIL